MKVLAVTSKEKETTKKAWTSTQTSPQDRRCLQKLAGSWLTHSFAIQMTIEHAFWLKALENNYK